jgi:hypothetical protein
VSDNATPGGEYEVGYGKPPLNTRFQKGQSGNPKGRPKGSLNFATILERTLRERVVVNEGGRRRIITKLEAAIKQLVNKAAGGDLNAFRLLRELARSGEEAVQPQPTVQELNADDQSVMASILKRFEESFKAGEQ